MRQSEAAARTMGHAKWWDGRRCVVEGAASSGGTARRCVMEGAGSVSQRPYGSHNSSARRSGVGHTLSISPPSFAALRWAAASGGRPVVRRGRRTAHQARSEVHSKYADRERKIRLDLTVAFLQHSALSTRAAGAGLGRRHQGVRRAPAVIVGCGRRRSDAAARTMGPVRAAGWPAVRRGRGPALAVLRMSNAGYPFRCSA